MKKYAMKMLPIILMILVTVTLSLYREEIDYVTNRIWYHSKIKQAEEYFAQTYNKEEIHILKVHKAQKFEQYYLPFKEDNTYVVECLAENKGDRFTVQITKAKTILDGRLYCKIKDILYSEINRVTIGYEFPHFMIEYIHGFEKMAEEIKNKVDYKTFDDALFLETILATQAFSESQIDVEVWVEQRDNSISDEDAVGLSNICSDLLQNGMNICVLKIKGVLKGGDHWRHSSQENFSQRINLKDITDISADYIKSICVSY